MNKKIKKRILKKVPKERRAEVLFFFLYIERFHPLIRFDTALLSVISNIELYYKYKNPFAFYHSIPRWVSECYEVQYINNWRKVEERVKHDRVFMKLCVKKLMY